MIASLSWFVIDSSDPSNIYEVGFGFFALIDTKLFLLLDCSVSHLGEILLEFPLPALIFPLRIVWYHLQIWPYHFHIILGLGILCVLNVQTPRRS